MCKLAGVGAVWLGYTLWVQNRRIQVEEFTYRRADLPKGLDGCRIVHLSDLHDRRFGKGQRVLGKALDVARGDLIVVTGDFLNRKTAKRKGTQAAMEALLQASRRSPVYFVGGNNEWESDVYPDFLQGLRDAGIKVLENAGQAIQVKDGKLWLMGLSDVSALPEEQRPKGYSRSYFYCPDKRLPPTMARALEELCRQGEGDPETLRVLLTHRPSWAGEYGRRKIDLVLCGHAHGGQARLPLLGGLFAPQQGILPRYTQGAHRFGRATMYISRGMGNNGIPCRFFNDPQVQVVTLRRMSSGQKTGNPRVISRTEIGETLPKAYNWP